MTGNEQTAFPARMLWPRLLQLRDCVQTLESARALWQRKESSPAAMLSSLTAHHAAHYSSHSARCCVRIVGTARTERWCASSKPLFLDGGGRRRVRGGAPATKMSQKVALYAHQKEQSCTVPYRNSGELRPRNRLEARAVVCRHQDQHHFIPRARPRRFHCRPRRFHLLIEGQEFLYIMFTYGFR